MWDPGIASQTSWIKERKASNPKPLLPSSGSPFPIIAVRSIVATSQTVPFLATAMQMQLQARRSSNLATN